MEGYLGSKLLSGYQYSICVSWCCFQSGALQDQAFWGSNDALLHATGDGCDHGAH